MAEVNKFIIDNIPAMKKFIDQICVSINNIFHYLMIIKTPSASTISYEFKTKPDYAVAKVHNYVESKFLAFQRTNHPQVSKLGEEMSKLSLIIKKSRRLKYQSKVYNTI